MAVVTNARKRAILDSAKGQMFHVTFKKADGSIREMQAKKWCEQAFASGDRNNVGASNAPEDNYVLCDMEAYKVNPKRAFRSLKLDNLMSCKVAGIEYNFDQQ